MLLITVTINLICNAIVYALDLINYDILIEHYPSGYRQISVYFRYNKVSGSNENASQRTGFFIQSTLILFNYVEYQWKDDIVVYQTHLFVRWGSGPFKYFR
ncbi:MAG: hypothetical protein ACQEXQ_01180 [Bacillota bacterium]